MKSKEVVGVGPGRHAERGVRVHLSLNGAALFAVALGAYIVLRGSWWLFAVLIFAPDLFMVGYAAGPRMGATVYNLGHSLVIPAALLGAGVLIGRPTVGEPGVWIEVALIWAAHIGIDRAFGFGYKYPTEFKDTDLSRA